MVQGPKYPNWGTGNRSKISHPLAIVSAEQWLNDSQWCQPAHPFWLPTYIPCDFGLLTNYGEVWLSEEKTNGNKMKTWILLVQNRN